VFCAASNLNDKQNSNENRMTFLDMGSCPKHPLNGKSAAMSTLAQMVNKARGWKQEGFWKVPIRPSSGIVVHNCEKAHFV
jgi:hypothetical protein